jgi:hypothetical protein
MICDLNESGTEAEAEAEDGGSTVIAGITDGAGSSFS